MSDQVLQDAACRQRRMEIERGVIELEQFMRTDGQVARELLCASKCHINFGEEKEGGGFGVVYFIDGKGLQKSVEAMGMWTAYSKDVPKPKLLPITAHQAIEASVYYGGKKGTEVVNWLRGELDKIASSAPASE